MSKRPVSMGTSADEIVVTCLDCGEVIPKDSPLYMARVNEDRGNPLFGCWCLLCGPNVIDEDGHRPRRIDPAELRRSEIQ
jgi:hypothetical protein